MNKQHNYSLEIDVIEAGGVKAISKTCEKGNKVWINLEEIEKRAQDKKDRYRNQFKKVLEYINKNSKKIKDKNEYEMPSGGILLWGEKPKKNFISLTKDESLKSKFKRDGLIVGKDYQNPNFLHYGPEVLKKGVININYNGNLKNLTLEQVEETLGGEIFNNQMIVVNSGSKIYRVEYPLIKNHNGTRFRINEDKEGRLVEISRKQNNVIFPEFRLRNLEQKLAYSQLIDRNIEFNIINGGSGSGKTILPYIAAMQLILGNEKDRKKQKLYDGIVLFKSNDKIGDKDRDEGFRPGDLYEKNAEYLKSYKDAHKLAGLEKYLKFEELFFSGRERNIEKNQSKNTNKEKTDKTKKQQIKSEFNIEGYHLPRNNPAIEVEYSQFMRGRTLENMVIIIDETQNFTPFEMKHLIERVGINSKIILIGDSEQVDNSSLNNDFNGLVYAANIMFGTHPRFAINTLYENFRSQSAEYSRKEEAPLH